MPRPNQILQETPDYVLERDAESVEFEFISDRQAHLDFFREAFALEQRQATREQGEPLQAPADPNHDTARVRAAWRLMRCLALYQGRLEVNLPLEDLAPAPQEFARLTPLARMAITVKIGQQPHRFRDAKHSFLVSKLDIPILPPTNDQKKLKAWIEGMEVLSTLIGCDLLHHLDPPTDSETLWGILDPTRTHQSIPDFYRVMAYERALTDKVTGYLVRHGTKGAYDRIRKNMVLSNDEATMLISMARKHARNSVEYDQEEERAVMTMRLQEIQKRARKQFNLREELNAIKQESLVRGLTKSQPEGFMDVFAKVVEKAAKHPTLPPRQEETLQLTEAVVTTPIEYEEGEEQ